MGSFRSRGIGFQISLLVSIVLLATLLLVASMLWTISQTQQVLLEQQKTRVGQILDMEVQKIAAPQVTGPGTVGMGIAGAGNAIGGGTAKAGDAHARTGSSRTKQRIKKFPGVGSIRLPKVSAVKPLSSGVRQAFNEINRLYPGVELGYYSIEHQAIIIGNLPGDLSISEAFSLQQQNWFNQVVKSRQRTIIQAGTGETGRLEGYAPVIKAGKVLGVVWAKEDLDEILGEIERSRRNAYGIMVIGLLVGVGGTALFVNGFVEGVKGIKTGLEKLKGDLHYVLPESPGEIGEISASINNLSDELLKMRSYTEIILDSIDEGILAVNEAGRVIIINDAAVHLLGLDNANALGQEFTAVLGEGELAEMLWSTLGQEKGLRDQKLSLTLAARGQMELLAGTSVLRDYRGKFLGVALTVRDITEREKLLRIFRRNERLSALGTLVAGVAHEIRNPLTAIRGYVQFWMKKSREQQPSEKSLQTINREINRLNDLVEKLLYFARPGKARMAFHDINQILVRVLTFVQEINQVSVEVGTHFAAELPPVYCDRDQIERVFNNIVFNACQAMPQGGKLSVESRYEAQADVVRVAIRDTGEGIPAENLSALFNPFFTTKAKGTGLGLAIAHEIVRTHGGDIEVSSIEDEGSEFVIILPRMGTGDPGSQGTDSAGKERIGNGGS